MSSGSSVSSGNNVGSPYVAQASAHEMIKSLKFESISKTCSHKFHVASDGIDAKPSLSGIRSSRSPVLMEMGLSSSVNQTFAPAKPPSRGASFSFLPLVIVCTAVAHSIVESTNQSPLSLLLISKCPPMIDFKYLSEEVKDLIFETFDYVDVLIGYADWYIHGRKPEIHTDAFIDENYVNKFNASRAQPHMPSDTKAMKKIQEVREYLYELTNLMFRE